MSQPSARDTSVAAIVIGIYMILLAVIFLCIGTATIGCGGIIDSLTSLTARQAATAPTTPAGGALTVALGIATLFTGVLSLIIAIGLFLTRPWAYMSAVILNAVVVGLEVLNILTGASFVIPLPVILASGAAILSLLRDRGARQAFGRA